MSNDGNYIITYNGVIHSLAGLQQNTEKNAPISSSVFVHLSAYNNSRTT
jgi:hypothetical protein